jgi:hypothetical protein
MVSYIGPILFALLGAFTIAGLHHETSVKVLANRSDYDIEHLRQSLSGRLMVLGQLIPPAYCAYGVVAATWTGSPAWWAWLVALVAQVVAAYVGHESRRRFYELTQKQRYLRPEPDADRARRVATLVILAFLAMEVNGYLLPEGGGGEAAWKVLAGACLVVLTVSSLLAAGWTSIGILRSYRPVRRTART